MVDITGLTKADVLAALFNASHPQGWGWLHSNSEEMTVESAKALIDARGGELYFDYIQGRVIKVDLASDTFNSSLYDRDNGQGAAQRAIDGLRTQHTKERQL